MSEILAGVSAARAVSSAQLNQLQTEMKRVTEEIEFMEKRKELLEEENATLLPERELKKCRHSDVVEQLNEQLLEKAKKQIALNELKVDIRSKKEKIEQLEAARKHLAENLTQEKRSCAEMKEMLQKELTETKSTIQEQKKTNAECRRDLDAVSAELMDREERIKDHSKHISQLERSISRLQSSHQKHAQQLEEQIRNSEENHRMKELKERELRDVGEDFHQEVLTLQRKITEVDKQLDEGQKLNRNLLESLAESSSIFSVQRKKEDEALADHHSLKRQLEKSKQRLEERVASIATYKQEVKKMEEEMKRIHETNKVSAALFEKNVAELRGRLAKEKQSRAALEVERDELCQSLEVLKEQHEHDVKELSSGIALMKQKHGDLQEEEKQLQEHVGMDSLIRQLTDTVSRAEEERRRIEDDYRAEIQQLKTETELITRAQQDQEETLKVQESVLKEAEAQLDADISRNQTLKKHTSEMKNRKNSLELFIQELRKQTAALLQSKEDIKRELQALRAERMEMLVNQAAEISSTEKHIYESGLMLEQVDMENSRLHLRIEQMKEDLFNAETEKETHSEQMMWMKEAVQSLCVGLTEAWVTDRLATEESANRDQTVIEELHRLILKFQRRGHHIGDISSRLETELDAISSMLQSTTHRQNIHS
ncbi:coiled-coil domain-containing protein 175 isoform X2 [Hoplias malabaricus]